MNVSQFTATAPGETLEDAIARVKAIPRAPKHQRSLPDVWQNANGTWTHHKDGKREWRDRLGCVTDLRFAMEWEAA